MRLGLDVSAAPERNLGYHLVAKCGSSQRALTILVKTNWKPKPAGGSGPPALAWRVSRDFNADLVAFADLESGRIWLISRKELPEAAQQHSKSAHQLVMVTQTGWTSAPHERIRDDQFTNFLAERRIAELFGA
jgi:hypothetical protein